MRALPFLFSGALLLFGATAMPRTAPAQTSAAAALVPLASALGVTPTGASVEVYATRIESAPPDVGLLERKLLQGASWQTSALGAGFVYRAAQGSRSARIAVLPLPHGRHFVSCSSTEVVPPAKVANAIEQLWQNPCGTNESSVVLSGRLDRHPGASAIAQAIRSIGATPMGVLAGQSGAFALAQLPGGRPEVTVGGRAMNLALQISYDKASIAQVRIGAPTLRPGP